jgi:hypothetical protein
MVQLAQALVSVFPTLQFTKDETTGTVVITTPLLAITLTAETTQGLAEGMSCGCATQAGSQPLGASSAPAYVSTDKTPVPVMSHPIALREGAIENLRALGTQNLVARKQAA